MENFDYFDALKESLEQAVDYTKGDKAVAVQWCGKRRFLHIRQMMWPGRARN